MDCYSGGFKSKLSADFGDLVRDPMVQSNPDRCIGLEIDLQDPSEAN